MSADVRERFAALMLSVKHLWHLPSITNSLRESFPWPSPTVAASRVPNLFREPYILSGYRPGRQRWRCYLLSVFQRHNESLNVWTHLLAIPVILIRWWANVYALGCPLDTAFLPLGFFVLSSLTYLCLSVAAHLLQSRSERAHYFFFFMDYVGVAVYQYGCSLGHYFYTSEAEWRESVGVFFLPAAAALAWLSCAGCCFAKSRYRRPYPVQRKICQLIPTGLAYLLDISPVVHRLLTVPWTPGSSHSLHALQITSFLMAAFFFSCPVPERFFPGRCDFVGQGHQVFHVFLSTCTAFQLEALFRDYVRKRGAVVEVFGEKQLRWACLGFPVLLACCISTALWAMKYTDRKLQSEKEKKY